MAKTKKVEYELVPSMYINPLTDFGFKKLFLNKDLLIAFLNDIVETNIKDIQYQPTESLGEQFEERKAVFDLLCTTDKNEYFIVEMQLGKQAHFKDWVVFYASHVIRKQAPRKKHWNYELKAVYVISILDFITFTEDTASDEIIERIYLYRDKAQKQYSEKLNFIFVELPKFNKQVSELKNNTETWLFLLKNTFALNTRPPEITGKIFKRFLELAEVKQLTPTEMEKYEKLLKKDYALREAVYYARDDERRLMAKKLLKRNTPVEDIIFLTNLTKEQVQEVLDDI
jgi:predicted transposase/invertase (TIGR01784 family)